MKIWTLLVIHESDFPRDLDGAVTLHHSSLDAVITLREDFADDLAEWGELTDDDTITETALLNVLASHGVYVSIDEHRI